MEDYRKTMWGMLTDEQYVRLCECRSHRADIVPIAKCFRPMCKTAEEAVYSALEHLSWNSQYFDLTDEEYSRMIAEVEEG